MSSLIALLLGLDVVPSGTLVWANGGLAMAVVFAVALLVSGASLFAVREKSRPVRRLSVASPALPNRTPDARLPSAA